MNSKFPEFFIIGPQDLDTISEYPKRISEKYNALIEYDQERITNSELYLLLYKIMLSVFFVIFILRYLYLLTNWAIKILRQKD